MTPIETCACRECRPDPVTREELIDILGQAMSDVSEDCWCAGWLDDTEEDLPKLVAEALRTGEPQPWGLGGYVSPEAARHLAGMRERLGAWVMWVGLSRWAAIGDGEESP